MWWSEARSAREDRGVLVSLMVDGIVVMRMRCGEGAAGALQVKVAAGVVQWCAVTALLDARRRWWRFAVADD